jgi:hypothetical protein
MTQSNEELLYTEQEEMNVIDRAYVNLKEKWSDSVQDIQTLDQIVIPVIPLL